MYKTCVKVTFKHYYLPGISRLRLDELKDLPLNDFSIVRCAFTKGVIYMRCMSVRLSRKMDR